MKNDIVDDILKVESDAKQIVEKAKSDARDLVYNAQIDASKSVKAKVEQVRNEGNDALQTRMEINRKQLDEYKARLEKELESGTLDNEAVISEAAKKIVAAVSAVAF